MKFILILLIISPYLTLSVEPFIQSRIDYIQKKYNIKCPIPEDYKRNDVPMASLIDHTVLYPETTPDQVDQLCKEAKEYNFAAVCVNPCYAKQASNYLKGTNVKVACVIDFPLGCSPTESKVFIAKQAIEDGAKEIDMVINFGFLKAGLYKEVFNDIKLIANEVHKKNNLLKVIIESTALGSDELIADACLLSAAAGADFVKTSTGFHASGGAKPEHVKLMRQAVGAKLGVKASGGIRTKEDAVKMIDAGANRLGCSKGIQIVKS